MKVRKLDANGDMKFGRGLDDFWIDVPDGVAQCASTRLHMKIGEWWLDLLDGTGWDTRVLGKYTGSTRDVEIRRRLIGTPGCEGIAEYGSQVNRETRAFSVQARLDTAYGAAKILEPL